MNPATEATLQELLQVAKQMNVNIEKFTSQLGSASSGGGGAGNTGGIGGLVKNSGLAGVALGALNVAAGVVGGAFNILGNILGKVVTGITDTVANLFKFAVAAADGTQRLSDFYMAFKDLPFFIGSVAEIFAKIISISEKYLDVYVQLTKVGASFGGDLFEMRNQAARANLTLAEFANIVSSNSELFATMGGNVQAGIDKFVLAQQKLLGPGSPYAKSISGLGVSAADAAEYLTTVITAQASLGGKNKMTADDLAKATNEYIVELDTLSKLTGIRKDQLDAEIKKTEADAVFQTFLDSLDPEAQKKANQQLADAMAMGGAEYRDYVKKQLMGIDSDMTPAIQQMSLATGGLIVTMGQQRRQLLHDTQVTAEEQNIISKKMMGTLGSATYDFVKSLGPEMQAVLGKNLPQQLLAFGRIFEKNGRDMDKTLAEIKRQQAAQAAGNAGNLLIAQQQIRQFGNQIIQIINIILKPITDVLAHWGTSLTQWLSQDSVKLTEAFSRITKSLYETLEPYVTGTIKWFKNTFDYLSKSESTADFWTRFKTKFVEGLHNIWDAVGPPLMRLWNDDIKPAIKNALVGVMEWLIEALRRNSLIARLLFGETAAEKIEKDEASIKLLKEQMQRNAEQVERLVANKRPEELRGQAGAQYRAMTADNERMMQDIARLEAEIANLRGNPLPVANVPGKAAGGPIRAGTYLVGEKGPELVTTGSGGNVITNENISELLNTLSESNKENNNLVSAMQMLNNQTRQILTAMQDMADYTRRNNDALRRMTGDAFA
jgi:hypothetical protein